MLRLSDYPTKAERVMAGLPTEDLDGYSFDEYDYNKAGQLERSQWLFMNLFSVCGVFLQPEVKGYRTDCIIQIVCLIVSIKTSNTICGCEHSNFATGAHNLPLWWTMFLKGTTAFHLSTSSL